MIQNIEIESDNGSSMFSSSSESDFDRSELFKKIRSQAVIRHLVKRKQEIESGKKLKILRKSEKLLEKKKSGKKKNNLKIFLPKTFSSKKFDVKRPDSPLNLRLFSVSFLEDEEEEKKNLFFKKNLKLKLKNVESKKDFLTIDFDKKNPVKKK